MQGGSIKIVLVIIVTTLLSAIPAVAVPFGGVITFGTSERGSGTASETLTAYPGNVSATNVSGIAITSRWAGFYGLLGGNILLADASNYKFFLWTVSNYTDSVVYAANDTISDWSLKPLNNTYVPEMVLNGFDSFDLTFTQTGVFSSNSIGPISDTPYTLTYQEGIVGILKTYALLTSDNAVNVWAGVAVQNATSFKPGQNVDYQIIVPASTTGTQYNFYLELP